MTQLHIWNAIIESYHFWHGSEIKFTWEVQKYTVQASNKFFSICTKPFNAKKTVLYTIIDWSNKIRGPENLLFWAWAETKEQCEEMLERLTIWETEVSYRNRVPLHISNIVIRHKRLDKEYHYPDTKN